MGSDNSMNYLTNLSGVSIRAPAWGATGLSDGWRRLWYVSIRAPAWGATLDDPQKWYELPVSIRAPAWGATWHCRAPTHSPAGFNSRSRMGSDTSRLHAAHGHDVSIRAPAWGATRSMPSSPPPTRCFNSRSRMGSDCHHAMTGTACIESALFASQAGKVLWGKMQFVYHVFKSISIHHAISAANTPAFR